MTPIGTGVRTCFDCAPTALRMPISRVRSVTDTSMMFMMPMPPTSSEMPAIAAQQDRHAIRVELGASAIIGLVTHLKVVLLTRGHCASREGSSLISVSRIDGRKPTSDRGIRERKISASNRLALGRRTGNHHRVVRVLLKGRTAFRRQHADDPEGQATDPDRLTHRVGPCEEARATVSPSTATRATVRTSAWVKQSPEDSRPVAHRQVRRRDASPTSGHLRGCPKTSVTGAVTPGESAQQLAGALAQDRLGDLRASSCGRARATAERRRCA